jgi:hypothetical protein
VFIRAVVPLALGVLDDLVVDRCGQQRQRRDRRAQIVRDGGEELAAHLFLAREAGDHLVHLAAEARDLVVAVQPRAHVAPPLPHGRERVTHGLEVAQSARAQPVRDPQHQSRRIRRQQDGHQRVVAGGEHQRHEQRDAGRELHRAQRGHEPELHAQPARPPPRDQLPRQDRQHRQRRDDLQRDQRTVPVVEVNQDDGGDRQRQRQREDQGAKRYPTPHTVSIQRGASGSASSFARSRRMCTVTVDVSV